MKIENIIRRVLREEQEEQILKIPGLKFFNNDWNVLQMFLESQGNPRYSIGGDLNLRDSDVKSLGNLVRVEGDLNLSFSDIETLGNLERVEGGLDLSNSDVKTLGNLVRVDSYLYLYNCIKLQSLGNLEYVGRNLDLKSTPLSKKYTEEKIRDMVEVGRNIFM